MPDQIVDIVLNAGNGRVLDAAGRLAGVSPEEAREACRRLVPEIARRARRKAETDQAAYDELLELIEDDSTEAVLEDSSVLESAETAADGSSILAALYGAPEQAKASAGRAGPMMPLLAVLTLAAISRRGRQSMRGAAAMPDRGSAGGLVGAIVSALLAGLVKGLTQALQRRSSRSRRSSYGMRRRSTAAARRRRGRQPSLEDIFGDILRRR